MNKNEKPKKEKFNQKANTENSPNTINTTPKIQNINTNNIINQHSKQITQKKEEKDNEKDNEIILNKINKPNELKELDALSHFKQNIIYYEKNCSDPITNLSYYCFSCKQSVCYRCGLNAHKEHILIQRSNCLNYDKTFFNEISKIIEESLLIEDKKNCIKNKISNSINELKNSLDNLKNNKFKEVDNIFSKLKNNLIDLRNNYLKTKKNLEEYYSTNKDFFNIYIEDISNRIDFNKAIFNMEISYHNDTPNNNNNSGNNSEESDIKNNDIENTIFLLNFDLMNLCDNKNLKILDFINNIKNKINIYLVEIDKKSSSMQKDLMHYLDLPLDIGINEDFYKEINSRVMKYSEHINQFKETICEIVKKTSNFDKIKDLIHILESKNNKGKKGILEQDFFKNPYIKNNSDNIKIRKNSKNKKLKRGISGDFKLIERNSHKKSIKIENKTDNYISLNNLKTNLLKRDSSKNKKNSISPFKTLGNKKNLKNGQKIKKSISFYGDKNNYKPLNSINIILNKRVLQKFFAYTIHSFYSKYYDIFKNKENAKKLNGKNNKNILESKIKTVSYLANYTRRYNKLKEQVKPIIGTNQIQICDLLTKKITKKTVNLTKEEHGYTLFPEGCRHILLNNNLYITGGTDMYGMPINIVLFYNTQNNTISKSNNLIDNHSYHTLDYLEKYDCVILIGGENSSCCEIMDAETKKWYKLPELNYPRANANIYFNFITNDLFVLFGINGDISSKTMKYSDVIEVMEMNNISNGWAKVDYYRGSGFNLKNNFCMTLPFTKDKLLIYGADNMRSNDKNLFSLFDLNKNECMKVDLNTLEQIKIEEKKIRLFDLALNKMNFDN